jgi:carboxylesterase type B
LYLNIITPSELSNSLDDYPVLFIIHGGGYEYGSALRYSDHKQLIRKFVSKGIVIVTIQYRLGLFGFASTGDDVLPGNLGLWDQVAALKFVKRDIHNFGGDRNRITLYGYSAGSASVAALTLSPHSRDMFARAFQGSGSLFAQWTTSEKVVNATQEIVNVLKCNNTDPTKIKICLKQKSVNEFSDAIEVTGSTRYDINFVKFGPRLDGDFFPKDYPALIEEAPKKPTVLGCTQEESLSFSKSFSSQLNCHKVSPYSTHELFYGGLCNTAQQIFDVWSERLGAFYPIGSCAGSRAERTGERSTEADCRFLCQS